MIKPLHLIFFILIIPAGLFAQTNRFAKILVEVPKGNLENATLLAIERIREYTGAVVQVSDNQESEKSGFDLTLILGTGKDMPKIQTEWKHHSSVKEDAYLLHTISGDPLTILVSGENERGVLYAAYQLADLIRAEKNISTLDLFFEPKIAERYISFGATTHGRRYFRPALYYESLKELPRYGYNGVIIYPGGGTPIGRRSSPVLEADDGQLYMEAKNTKDWKKWFGEIDMYHDDIMMAIPPLVPPGYTTKEIDDFYAGGPEPDKYLSNLQNQFRKFLELLMGAYPEIDRYLFNSTEGATFGNNKRFFGHPDPERFSNDAYLTNNEKIMRAYFDVLKDIFAENLGQVGFWTHSFGLTSNGIKKMREVLFEYPQVLIVEDDFWNNNLWPMDIPAMSYLPPDLRAEISTKNPFALFQIVTDGEYYGGGSLPNAYPDSHIRTASEAIDRNAQMVIQRIDLNDRTPFGTLFGTVEIVPFAASKQLWTPTPKEEYVWKEWADRRFGKKASPYVINALQKSKNILINGLSCNGMDLLAVGSEINPRLWAYDGSEFSRFYLFAKPGEPMLKKTFDDIIYSGEYTVFQMDTHTIAIKEFLDNQDSALNSIDYALGEIEKAKPYLEQKDYDMLKEIYLNGRHVLNALKVLGKAAYAGNLVLSNYDHVKNPSELLKRSLTDLETFIKKNQLIPEMNANLMMILKNYRQIGESE